MKENIMTATDERMVGYGRALKRALKFEKDIKRNMQEGKGTIYLTIVDKTRSHSGDLDIGKDLPKIPGGAAFGAYCELAYDTIFVKETGKIRVINPVGKAIADEIISDMSRQDNSRA